MSTLIRAAQSCYQPASPTLVKAGWGWGAAGGSLLVIKTKALGGFIRESGFFFICLIILKVRLENVCGAAHNVTSEREGLARPTH